MSGNVEHKASVEVAEVVEDVTLAKAAVEAEVPAEVGSLTEAPGEVEALEEAMVPRQWGREGCSQCHLVEVPLGATVEYPVDAPAEAPGRGGDARRGQRGPGPGGCTCRCGGAQRGQGGWGPGGGHGAQSVGEGRMRSLPLGGGPFGIHGGRPGRWHGGSTWRVGGACRGRRCPRGPGRGTCRGGGDHRGWRGLGPGRGTCKGGGAHRGRHRLTLSGRWESEMVQA